MGFSGCGSAGFIAGDVVEVLGARAQVGLVGGDGGALGQVGPGPVVGVLSWAAVLRGVGWVTCTGIAVSRW
ncbi:hypothetical protein GCM10011374_24440 [Kocuria dechangensis]|uniref:Uncharacterized protein n=1 Tax=Kocuria dechangensis TaxID=1176249 RepID=A0A917GYM4_9MICC|nr:hypothetical protein GCM10011374_24440 [Kocuria dechangensis]